MLKSSIAIIDDAVGERFDRYLNSIIDFIKDLPKTNSIDAQLETFKDGEAFSTFLKSNPTWKADLILIDINFASADSEDIKTTDRPEQAHGVTELLPSLYFERSNRNPAIENALLVILSAELDRPIHDIDGETRPAREVVEEWQPDGLLQKSNAVSSGALLSLIIKSTGEA